MGRTARATGAHGSGSSASTAPVCQRDVPVFSAKPSSRSPLRTLDQEARESVWSRSFNKRLYRQARRPSISVLATPSVSSARTLRQWLAQVSALGINGWLSAASGIGTSTHMAVDPVLVASSSGETEGGQQQSLMFELMDTDMITETWSWLHNFALNDGKQQDTTDWSNHDLNQFDSAPLRQLPDNILGGIPTSSPPQGLPSPISLPSTTHVRSQSHTALGALQRQPMEKPRERSNTLGSMRVDETPSLRSAVAPVIAQLSQLSTRLSALYDSSSHLANSVQQSSATSLSDGRQAFLVHTAAFEQVAAWLAKAHDQVDSYMTPNPGGLGRSNSHISLDSLPHQSSEPPALDASGHNSQGILHEVFSASHSFLETLRFLHINGIGDQPDTPTIPTMNTTSIAPDSLSNHDNKGYFGRLPSEHSSPNMLPPHCQMIIRHLVMACDILLLQIYVAVLVALQYDAQPSVQMSGTVLGDVRLVLVVHLCSHLIERQQRAVDQYFASVSSTTPLSPLFPEIQPVDRQASSALKKQVHARLAQLRQALQSSTI